jgi:hypothetical protein
MDFHAIDAPLDCPEEPNKFYVEKGFKPPFKTWY